MSCTHCHTLRVADGSTLKRKHLFDCNVQRWPLQLTIDRIEPSRKPIECDVNRSQHAMPGQEWTHEFRVAPLLFVRVSRHVWTGGQSRARISLKFELGREADNEGDSNDVPTALISMPRDSDGRSVKFVIRAAT